MKREAELKAKFMKELHRQLPAFLVLQYSTNAAPDREIVGMGVTTRWEMKHATPQFASPGDQELMCCRLAVAAHCRYIVWYEHCGVERTLIVHPRHVFGRTNWNLETEAWCVGLDMKWLVDYIRKMHEQVEEA